MISETSDEWDWEFTDRAQNQFERLEVGRDRHRRVAQATGVSRTTNELTIQKTPHRGLPPWVSRDPGGPPVAD